MKIKKAVNFFLTGYFTTRERSPKTVTAYTIDLRQFADYLGGKKKMKSVSERDVERWVAQMRVDGYSPTSIKRKLAAVKVFMKYLVRKKKIKKSPARDVRMDLGNARRLPKVLALEEIHDMLNTADILYMKAMQEGSASAQFLTSRNRAMVELLFATGIRIGELVKIRGEDFRGAVARF